MKESKFYCGVEYHLAKLGCVLAVYNLAYRLSKKSEKFAASAESVAQHFGLRRETIARAFKTLVDRGFFILLESGKDDFEPSVYYVVSHKLWAEAHPGQCCEKVSLPWSDGDTLGRDLHAASAGHVRFQDFQIANYRKTGLTDSEIVDRFKTFQESRSPESGKRASRKSAPVEFWRYLQTHGNKAVLSSAV